MNTQPTNQEFPDLSILMNTQPAHDPTPPPSRGQKKSSPLVLVSILLLILFFSATSAILIWQTQSRETIARVETQAEEITDIVPKSCKRLTIYKNGVAVTDFNTLRAGDTVTLATPIGSAVKARFTINKTEVESTKVTFNNEFIVDYTFPLDMRAVRIKVERKIDGIWQ